MRSGLMLFCLILCSISVRAQAPFSAEQDGVHVKAGAAISYWSTDYGSDRMYGPSAWFGTDFWRGLGVQVEIHSLIGGASVPHFSYVVGEAGPIYTLHRWQRAEPYVKAEFGAASLKTPQVGELHSTHGTWAVGGGVEYRTWRRLWTRIDYEYDGYPGFYSTNTNQRHTLNPNGITVGFTYHLK